MFYEGSLLIRQVELGKLHRVGCHDAGKDLVCIVEWTGEILENRVHVYVHLRRRCQIHGHVGQDIEPVDRDVVLEVVQLIVAQDTGILVV